MSDAPSAGAVPVPAVDGARPAPGPIADTPLASGVSAIWVRELRGRMRGKRAFIFVTVYLLFLAGLLLAGLNGITENPYFGAVEQVSAGRGLFTAVIMIETLVVVALAPAYTAGTISAEREKQTFDLLVVTPVSSLSIVVGKLLSGVSYLALIVGASIPLAAVAFLFGGVGPESLLMAYLILAVTGIGVGAIGVACSAVMKKTQPATVGAFIIVGILVVGATAAWGVMTGDAELRRRAPPPIAMLFLNPFVAEADLLCSHTATTCLPGITGELTPDPAIGFFTPAQMAATAGRIWPFSVLAWMLVAAAALAVGSRALRPARRPLVTRPAPPIVEPVEPVEPER